MRSQNRCVIRVGDLVLPVDEQEFLFSSPDKVADESDPLELIWNASMPGVVIGVLQFNPEREYYHIKIIVEDAIGWTYSDYVKRIY